jgi:hypothetical protein
MFYTNSVCFELISLVSVSFNYACIFPCTLHKLLFSNKEIKYKRGINERKGNFFDSVKVKIHFGEHFLDGAKYILANIL